MDIEHIPVDLLHADPANARRHPERNVEAIKASLARFGQVKPIVVDAGNVVRAGNGTLHAARALGWASLACVRMPHKGAEATAYAIADNRTAELAEWDGEVLAETLKALQDEDFDLASVGYDEAELEAMVGGMAVPEFAPVGEEEQGRLDEKAKVECPNCGHEFSP